MKKRNRKSEVKTDMPVILAFVEGSKEVTASTYKCKKTGKEVIATDSYKPFSPFKKGSFLIKSSNSTESISTEESDKSDLVKLGTCSDASCAAEHYSDNKETASLISTCTVCGSDMNMEDFEEEEMPVEEEEEEVVVEDLMEEVESEKDEMDSETETDTETEEEEETEEVESNTEEEDMDKEEEDMDKDMNMEKEIEVSNLKVFLDGMSSEDLAELKVARSMNRDGSKGSWFLFNMDMPLASSKFEDASSEVQDIFNDEEMFTKALFSAIGEDMSAKDLEAFGFKSIDSKISMDDAMTSEIEKEMSSIKAEIANDRKSLEAKFKQCFITASLGIQKGFFPECSNNLKAGFFEAMSSLGVQDAHLVIDNVFAKEGEDFLGSILSKTEELFGKSQESRNEIAKLVEKSSYRKAETSSSSVENAVSKNLARNSVGVSFVSESKETPKQEGSYKELFTF